MSIETKLEELTKSVTELTKVTQSLLELRADAIETVKGAAAPKAAAPKAAAAAPKAETKAEPEAKSDGDAYAGIKDMIATYVSGTDRDEERAARKTKVKSLLNHAKVKKPDVENATSVDHIMEASADMVRKNLQKFIDAGDLTEAPSADADDLDV